MAAATERFRAVAHTWEFSMAALEDYDTAELSEFFDRLRYNTLKWADLMPHKSVFCGVGPAGQ